VIGRRKGAVSRVQALELAVHEADVVPVRHRRVRPATWDAHPLKVRLDVVTKAVLVGLIGKRVEDVLPRPLRRCRALEVARRVSCFDVWDALSQCAPRASPRPVKGIVSLYSAQASTSALKGSGVELKRTDILVPSRSA